jgi:aromatic ring-cleaving dioxygenase
MQPEEFSGMSDDFAEPAGIELYHAHVYYAPDTKAVADRLRQAIGARFRVRLGNWHDEPVGPHPVAMYQVAFPVEEFANFVPWLMLNRGILTILVHPQTGDAVADHSQHALWLGNALPLRLEVLRRSAAD